MKAIIYDKKGLPDRLIYQDVDKPIPNDNELLIAGVAGLAAGLHVG